MERVEIVCRCKECLHFEELKEEIGYCFYWNYKLDEKPSVTTTLDFCSNAEKDNSHIEVK